jgi:hypothetical protein
MSSMSAPLSLTGSPNETKLVPSAFVTSGSGSALQTSPRRKTKVIYVEVNSYDRNYANYKTAADFQWAFPSALKEVIRIDIVEGSIPVPLYNVDEGWNKFTLLEDLVARTIVLRPGFYNAASLASELQNQLNAGANTFSVTVPSAATQRFCITKTAGPATRFAFMFGSGDFIDKFDVQNVPFISPENSGLFEVACAGRLLGFGSEDVQDKAGVINAPFPPDLESMLRRIYLYLNFDATMDLTSVKRGLGRKEPSGIFYCDADSPPGTTKFLTKDSWNNSIYPGPAPISRIRLLTVSLRDQFYRSLNLNGRELTLLLEVTMME